MPTAERRKTRRRRTAGCRWKRDSNRFVWNYRLPNATTLPGLILWGGSLAGPRVVPGNYQVRLTVDGKP